MLRAGADPESLQPGDFLCNFCRKPWADDRPMIEGHQGNLICGGCVTLAYTEVVLREAGVADAGAGDGPNCVMCLERRRDQRWVSPVYEDQAVCARCVRQAAGALVKDKDSGWAKPG